MAELTEDQRIIAKAIDLITSVSPAVLARTRRERDAGRGGTSPMVSSTDFANLADAIEARYPGAIEESRG